MLTARSRRVAQDDGAPHAELAMCAALSHAPLPLHTCLAHGQDGHVTLWRKTRFTLPSPTAHAHAAHAAPPPCAQDVLSPNRNPSQAAVAIATWEGTMTGALSRNAPSSTSIICSPTLIPTPAHTAAARALAAHAAHAAHAAPAHAAHAHAHAA